jgi:hypothetical protein
MKPARLFALILLLAAPAAFAAAGLTDDDLAYLKREFGLDRSSAVIAQLTPNQQNALHSAIDDLKNFPDSRDRQVRSYLWLVYQRQCKHWRETHADEDCPPAPTPEARPGKAISDHICASCHLFGTDTAASFHKLAQQRVYDAHKVSHALKHSQKMVPIVLAPEQLEQLAIYINSLK